MPPPTAASGKNDIRTYEIWAKDKGHCNPHTAQRRVQRGPIPPATPQIPSINAERVEIWNVAVARYLSPERRAFLLLLPISGCMPGTHIIHALLKRVDNASHLYSCSGAPFFPCTVCRFGNMDDPVKPNMIRQLRERNCNLDFEKQRFSEPIRL